tara:strand:+ start:1839 stop:3182 length:1344 start_codon:yes stop_codon:yes gene_type:complete
MELLKYLLTQQKLSYLLALLPLVLGGCAPRFNCGEDECKSSIVSINAASGTVDKGVMYSLPRQDLILKFERTGVTLAALKDAFSKIRESIDSIDAKLKILNQELKLKKNLLAKPNVTDDAKAKLTLEVSLLELEISVRKDDKAASQKALAKNTKELAAFTASPKPFKDTISMSVSDPYPDSENRLRATLNENYITSETIEIKTTAAGLLSGGASKSEGQLDEIIVSTVSAINALTGRLDKSSKSSSLYFTAPPKGAKCIVAPKPEIFTFIINLDDPDWASNLAMSLEKTSFCYNVELKTPVNKKTLSPSEHYDGLVYPQKMQFRFDITNKEDNSFIETLHVTAIDPTTFSYISLDRGLFVTNEYEYEFTNGMLTRYKATKPNEIVEILSIPVDVAKAIISIPAEILQLKIDYSSKEEAYIKAQQLVLEAQNSLNSTAVDSESDSALD